MDVGQFLARVVAPGNYMAIASKKPDRDGMTQRFYRYEEMPSAGKYLLWLSKAGLDAWYAVASFNHAELNGLDKLGEQKYRGARTQANAQSLRCFWVDLDVKRDGDGKQPDKVYADRNAALGWLKGFLVATQMPRPNLAVQSGYGLHVYWVLEDAIAPAEWQPYADALKAALIANNALTDVGISADSARLLRPPGTKNYKDPAKPAPVTVIDRLTCGDYPNDLIYRALQPFVGSPPATSNYGSAPLAGAPPAVMGRQQQPASNTIAAQANLPSRRDYKFGEIAKKCLQVKTSLANHGKGDQYPLWYLGFLSLAHFCVDGDQYVHPISQGDPRYDPAKTDAAFARVKAEHARKGTGAPTCNHFERARPGVCQQCPFQGRLTSPYTLGTDNGDLPPSYRRHSGEIQRATTDKDGNVIWRTVFAGDVYAPILDRLGADRKLTFTYEFGGQKSPVSTMQSAIPTDTRTATLHFGRQGIPTYKHNADQWGYFIVAWIEHLRQLRAERDVVVHPFGWSRNEKGDYDGFAVGGTLYRNDGTEEEVSGGDAEIHKMFQPRGSYTEWRRACDLVMAGRPDMQVLVASAFAAPLVELTGESGFAMSMWSQQSGVGKSSALRVACSVWGSPKAVFHMDDTANSIHKRLAEFRAMPSLWDEVMVAPNNQQSDFVKTLFRLSAGLDRARLNSDASLKTTGEWRTMLVMTANRPLMETIIHERGDTDAGALRLFEIETRRPPTAHDPTAAPLLASVDHNFGQAGRVYAAYVAKNAQKVRERIVKNQQDLGKIFGAAQEERFYIAGLSCVLVGAALATALGLAAFDVPSMVSLLKDTFEKLRKSRTEDLSVNAGTLDIERVFGDFVSDHSPDMLITEYFAKSGPKSPDNKVVVAPRSQNRRLVIHVGRRAQVMRIDKTIFREWCRTHNATWAAVMRDMKLRWAIKEGQGFLGASTPYRTGKVYYIDVPLVTPELMPYNYDTTK